MLILFRLDIKGRDVRYIQIPQYDGLSIKDISNFLEEGHRHVFQYMPDAQEIHKVPKQWIANVANSILKNIFSDWVKAQVESRNETVRSKKNMMIQMDPEIAAAFAASSKVSRKYFDLYHLIIRLTFFLVHHGVGANMLKTESKRRRTKQQIEEDKQTELAKENAMRTQLAQIQEM